MLYLGVWISIQKIFKSLSNYWHRVTCITSFERYLESSSCHTLNILWSGVLRFQEYVSDGISHPFLNCDLFYKLQSVKCKANFVSSGSKIVKRLRCRKYDQVIIERTIGLVFGTSSGLYRSFLKHSTLTDMRRGLYDGTCPNLLRGDKALILVPSYC